MPYLISREAAIRDALTDALAWVDKHRWVTDWQDKARAALAVQEPAGDPVAWLCEDLIFEGAPSVVMKEDCAKAMMARKEDWRVSPLYSQPPAPAVKVKPLEWQVRDSEWFWAAEGCNKMYYIRHYAGMRLPYRLDAAFHDQDAGHPTLEAAKAVAQADHDKGILSALGGVHPAKTVAEIAAEEARRIVYYEMSCAGYEEGLSYINGEYMKSIVKEGVKAFIANGGLSNVR